MNVSNKKIKYFLLFLGGGLYAAGLPLPYTFPGQFFLPILGISIFLYYLTGDEKKSIKSDFFSFLLFSSGYYLLGFYWIPYTIKEFGNIPFPFNYILGAFLVLFILPQYLIFIFLKHLLLRVKKWQRFLSSLYEGPLSGLKNIHFALLFVLLEYFVPQQFPAHLGHPWVGLWPYLGAAPLLGASGFSFFSFWPALAVVLYFKKKKIDYGGIIFFGVFLAFNFLSPLSFDSKRDFAASSTSKVNNIRLVQANIGNFLKLDSEKGGQTSLEVVLNTYFRLSMLPYHSEDGRPLDLIVWPETAFPSLLDTDWLKESPDDIPLTIKQSIYQTNAELFMGGYAKKRNSDQQDPDLDQDLELEFEYFETEYNAAFLFGGNDKEKITLKDHYYKIKLIPFGETLPFGPLNKFLSKFIDNISFFSPGEQFTLFTMRNGTRFISAICYEILFPELIRESLNKNDYPAHFIINLTNDSWYGDTSEPYQHLFLAKWRAIEFRIPIVRMTNTGITSVIYPDGSESKRTSLYKEEVLDLKLVTPDRNKTLYQILGIWSIIFFVLALTIMALPLKSLLMGEQLH